MEKRRFIARLEGELREQWNEFVDRKHAFDKWMEGQMRDLEERIREEGRPIEALHMMFWNHVYEQYGLDASQTFSVTSDGDVFELEPTHSLIEAIQTYGTTEPQFMEDDTPVSGGIWESPSSDEIN